MRSLFDSACDLDHDKRQPWLRRACNNDASMLSELESLLDAHDSAPSHFDTPVFQLSHHSPAPADDPTLLIGARLGHYEITRFIASGGMGHVFAARRADDQYDKIVAIKLIRQDVMNGAMVQRFQRERQALATFDHPHVARLLDAGVSADGCPYFVMEYVEGRTITDVCRADHLDIEARLELFLQVCDAVQCAHENLIVHCDLKPSNILVSGDGACKLLDFSIAKLVNQKPHEAVGATTAGRHMTPAYASPEQILGEPVNTRTDIYMLGVVLYEMLTDIHPFHGAQRPLYELERVICEIDPDRPSAVLARAANDIDSRVSRERIHQRRRLAGDLDAIVLKAMRRSSEERYRSVEQFANDIRHHLHGRPIEARPQTTVYRLHRFVKRNRGATIATLLAVVAMLGGTIGMSLLYRVATTQRTSAVTARELAEKQAQLADAESRRSAAVVEFLQSMMTAADPSQKGIDVKVVDVLKAASANMAAELADDPALESAVRSAIGKTYAGLGLYADAATHLRRALDIESRFADQVPEDEHVARCRSERLAGAHRELGAVCYEAGQLDEALQHACKALDISRGYSGAESAATAQDLNNLASIHRARGELDQALTLLKASADIRERVCGPASLELAESLNNLGSALRARGDFAGAETFSRRVLEIRRARLPEDHPTIAQSLDNLGVILAQQSRIDESIEFVRQAASIYRRVHPEGHPDLATNLLNLGSLLCLRGKFAEALEYLDDAASQRSRFFDAASAPVMTVEMIRGECLMQLRRYDEAKSILLAIEQRGERMAPANPAMLHRIRDDLAILFDSVNAPDQAAAWRQRNSASE